MSTDQPVWMRSLTAGADLSAAQFFLVKRHTIERQVVIVAATTDLPVGILQNKPAAVGRAAEIMAIGLSKAEVEATSDIAIGDKLGPNTDGRLIKKTTNNDIVCAIAEAPATSATGDQIPVQIFPPVWFGA